MFVVFGVFWCCVNVLGVIVVMFGGLVVIFVWKVFGLFVFDLVLFGCVILFFFFVLVLLVMLVVNESIED